MVHNAKARFAYAWRREVRALRRSAPLVVLLLIVFWALNAPSHEAPAVAPVGARTAHAEETFQ